MPVDGWGTSPAVPHITQPALIMIASNARTRTVALQQHLGIVAWLIPLQVLDHYHSFLDQVHISRQGMILIDTCHQPVQGSADPFWELVIK